MKLGIASWSVPWPIGVPGYPQPRHPLGALELLEKAVQANVTVVRIADNLPLHDLPDRELDRRARGIARRIGARILRAVVSGSLCGPEKLAAAEAGIREVLPMLDRRE